MITEDKVTELFCMADDFCKFFDAMMEKYTHLRPTGLSEPASDTLCETLPTTPKIQDYGFSEIKS